MRASKPVTVLCAVILMSMSEVGMSRSLLLPDPVQLAGHWQLLGQLQQVCDLHLEAGEGRLAGALDCAEGLLGMRPGSWLVTPDTLALVGADGSRVVHFNREGEGRYIHDLPNGQQLVLQRQDN